LKVLSRDEAKAFYDRFGARQDGQAFYEDPALHDLVRSSGFAHAASVVEFGCGTGRLAARLLSEELPAGASYLGLDLSDTMVALASHRLRPYGQRAEVRRCEGQVELPVPDRSVDRILSTYVIDLLSEGDTHRLLEEARRSLTPGGFLCLVGLTHGVSLVGRVVSSVWTVIHSVRPALVGGCRPMVLTPRLERTGWSILHSTVVRKWGIPSEVVVASPRGAGDVERGVAVADPMRWGGEAVDG
jgi:SAM-dependent methyltransferase